MGQARVLQGGGKPVARRRKPAQGATRNSTARIKPSRSFSWLNRLLILVGVGVVLAALVKAVLVLEAIPVERIVVTGKLEHTKTVALQEIVQTALVGGFLRVDLTRIQRQLETLPWVYQATVKRQWPSSLEVHVREQLPIARWGDDGFLNHAGDVFQSTTTDAPAALPLLTGPRGAQRQLIGDYQLVTQILQPLGLSVTALSVDPRGQLRATLAGGIEVALGDTQLRPRLERLAALYRVGLAQRKADIRSVDMRYKHGIAVSFTESTELAGI